MLVTGMEQLELVRVQVQRQELLQGLLQGLPQELLQELLQGMPQWLLQELL